MGAILLKNVAISDSRKDVLIDKGLICKIEPAGSCADWELAGDVEIMDCTGKAAIPGFINMHTHAAMSLMRGVGEDMSFFDWLAAIWVYEEKLDGGYVYNASKVASLEMIKTGTVAFNDQYWFPNECCKAALETGIRSMISYVILDKMDPEEAARQRDECEQMYEESLKWPELAKFDVSCHAVYTVSEASLEWARDFTAKHNLKLHIHLNETAKEVEDCKAAHGGLTPVEYIDSLGMLNENMIAAHTLWLSDHDVELLGKNHVNCVHNVNSNLKLASGYRFRYSELRDAGANICFGTDGCASSNNLDLLEAMKTSAILQKAWRSDPQALPLEEIMACATTNAAKALGLNTGKLEVGALADINIVDTDNTFFLSPAPFLANLIYSAHSDCIDSVICNGKFVMRHREVASEKEILREAGKLIHQINN